MAVQYIMLLINKLKYIFYMGKITSSLKYVNWSSSNLLFVYWYFCLNFLAFCIYEFNFGTETKL